MVEVDFDEQTWQVTRPGEEQAEEKGILGLIMKTGLVKDKNQATYVLVGLFVLCSAVAVYFFMSSGPSEVSPDFPTGNLPSGNVLGAPEMGTPLDEVF